ncbi:hypothetical protein TCDM_12545 [Trypanosoma cruzi Dm28c]|uniref:Uncharacterized protein n=1 Tax=Trypanosoma cruzi Dm28c TaxID=1416333 RepID=V5AL24_TRYCR|nr:hypothetical protein TCDM_12545 [Trypanosoma cruzi Dm28c]
MLGLCRSLSLPSLLLPLDPVTRRRLCVRGAITAATRESIQICVCGRCVCCWSFQCPAISQWRLAFSRNFLPSVCVREVEREQKTSQVKKYNSKHRHPSTVSVTIPAAVTPNNNNPRTQTHGTAEGRSLHREHTATVISSSRSHGGRFSHASAQTEQHQNEKQPAGGKRPQPPSAAPMRYRQSFHCCLLRHTTSHRRKSPRHQIHNKKDASAPAAAGQESLRTYFRHPQERTTKPLQTPFIPISRAAAARIPCVRALNLGVDTAP